MCNKKISKEERDCLIFKLAKFLKDLEEPKEIRNAVTEKSMAPYMKWATIQVNKMFPP